MATYTEERKRQEQASAGRASFMPNTMDAPATNAANRMAGASGLADKIPGPSESDIAAAKDLEARRAAEDRQRNSTSLVDQKIIQPIAREWASSAPGRFFASSAQKARGANYAVPHSQQAGPMDPSASVTPADVDGAAASKLAGQVDVGKDAGSKVAPVGAGITDPRTLRNMWQAEAPGGLAGANDLAASLYNREQRAEGTGITATRNTDGSMSFAGGQGGFPSADQLIREKDQQARISGQNIAAMERTMNARREAHQARVANMDAAAGRLIPAGYAGPGIHDSQAAELEARNAKRRAESIISRPGLTKTQMQILAKGLDFEQEEKIADKNNAARSDDAFASRASNEAIAAMNESSASHRAGQQAMLEQNRIANEQAARAPEIQAAQRINSLHERYLNAPEQQRGEIERQIAALTGRGGAAPAFDFVSVPSETGMAQGAILNKMTGELNFASPPKEPTGLKGEKAGETIVGPGGVRQQFTGQLDENGKPLYRTIQ